MQFEETLFKNTVMHEEAPLDQATNLRKLVDQVDKPVKTKISTTGVPREIKSKKNTRIITITSGKGGVGKTSVSVNLALSMIKAGQKVLLLDADLGLANLNVLMGVIPKYNLYHVVKGTKTMSEIIIKTSDGIDLIAGASGYSMLANLSAVEREKIITGFDTLSGYDVMIIDTGAGVGANVIGFTNPADQVLVVTTPEPTSITDAYGIIKSIVLQNPEKHIYLLVNRVVSTLEARKVAERVTNITNQFLNVKIETAGFIYEDPNVPKSIRKQKPFYALFPASKASNCLNLVTARLLNKDIDSIEIKNGMGGFFRKLFGAPEE